MLLALKTLTVVGAFRSIFFFKVEQLFTVSQVVCYKRASSSFRVGSKASRETA